MNCSEHQFLYLEMRVMPSRVSLSWVSSGSYQSPWADTILTGQTTSEILKGTQLSAHRCLTNLILRISFNWSSVTVGNKILFQGTFRCYMHIWNWSILSLSSLLFFTTFWDSRGRLIIMELILFLSSVCPETLECSRPASLLFFFFNFPTNCQSKRLYTESPDPLPTIGESG